MTSSYHKSLYYHRNPEQYTYRHSPHSCQQVVLQIGKYEGHNFLMLFYVIMEDPTQSHPPKFARNRNGKKTSNVNIEADYHHFGRYLEVETLTFDITTILWIGPAQLAGHSTTALGVFFTEYKIINQYSIDIQPFPVLTGFHITALHCQTLKYDYICEALKIWD